MKARLFKLNYEELLTSTSLSEVTILLIMDNFLRFEFLIQHRLKEDISEESKAGFEEGLESISFAENYLLKLSQGNIKIADTHEDYEYIINILHRGLRDLFKDENINESYFEDWLKSRNCE